MKLVILDRDGVINEDSDDYIKSVAEWIPIPGSLEAIARLCQGGWRVFIASNQAGIGRGLFDYDALLEMHAHLQQAVKALGGQIDGIAFAPEHPDQATEMRKPNPGMLRDIARRLGVGLDGVPFVGDTVADLKAARTSGARPILVRTGKGLGTEKVREARGVPVYDDLAAFASDLLQGA
jgi:D-glycero-D-manno-heptose 1,7-bisphosphate phosphatase